LLHAHIRQAEVTIAAPLLLHSTLTKSDANSNANNDLAKALQGEVVRLDPRGGALVASDVRVACQVDLALEGMGVTAGGGGGLLLTAPKAELRAAVYLAR
jgi:hypothetical protein